MMVELNLNPMSFTEIQSNVITLIGGDNNSYGPSAEVFFSSEISPCSIIITNSKSSIQKLSLQIRKEESDMWINYEEGQMILSKKVECRVACEGEGSPVMIKILHN